MATMKTLWNRFKKDFVQAHSQLFSKVEVKTTGLDRLINKFDKEEAKYRHDTKTVVVVGYSTSYAVYVHEDLTMRHKAGKTAKFLERPARGERRQMTYVMQKSLQLNYSWAMSLLRVGAHLQRMSQKIVPIDTGLLKKSAFTRLD